MQRRTQASTSTDANRLLTHVSWLRVTVQHEASYLTEAPSRATGLVDDQLDQLLQRLMPIHEARQVAGDGQLACRHLLYFRVHLSEGIHVDIGFMTCVDAGWLWRPTTILG